MFLLEEWPLELEAAEENRSATHAQTLSYFPGFRRLNAGREG